jgi:hypothetical protein
MGTRENISMTALSYSVADTRLQPSRQSEAPHQAGQERRDLDRLSCHYFLANTVRLQLHALAYGW